LTCLFLPLVADFSATHLFIKKDITKMVRNKVLISMIEIVFSEGRIPAFAN